MDMTLEKKNNQNIINMVPSVSLRDYLIKTEKELTALEQLSIIKASLIDIQKKKQEYLKYALDWRREVCSNALQAIGEIEIITSIINDKTGCYQYELNIEHSECKVVDSFQKLIPMINFFNMSEEKLNTYKVDISDLEDNYIAQIWINGDHEIIMYSIEGIYDDLGGLVLKELPFEHLQKVKFIKEMDDTDNYLYVDLNVVNLCKRGFLDAIPIIKENIYKEKKTKLDLVNNIQMVSNLIIE